MLIFKKDWFLFLFRTMFYKLMPNFNFLTKYFSMYRSICKQTNKQTKMSFIYIECNLYIKFNLSWFKEQGL